MQQSQYIRWCRCLVLIVNTGQVIQLLLNDLTFKLYTLSLQFNVQKPCNTACRHSIKMCHQAWIWTFTRRGNYWNLTTLVWINWWSFLCKDIDWAKLAFFKLFKYIYHKPSYADKNVLLHFFRFHPWSFYGAENWSIKLNKKISATFFSTLS